MEFDFIKEINKALKADDFRCSNEECRSDNIRVKSAELHGMTLDVVVCCNDCDEEWVEHFNLHYTGFTYNDEFIGVCENCGASLDMCCCTNWDDGN